MYRQESHSYKYLGSLSLSPDRHGQCRVVKRESGGANEDILGVCAYSNVSHKWDLIKFDYICDFGQPGCSETSLTSDIHSGHTRDQNPKGVHTMYWLRRRIRSLGCVGWYKRKRFFRDSVSDL